MGIMILPPDINQSGQEFKVIGNSIRFGLEAVKGVGSSTIESIIESRNTDGPFTSVANFLERVDQRKVNKKVIESLIKAGAFDSLGTTRSKAMDLMNSFLNTSLRNHTARVLGQQSIFSNTVEETAGDTTEWMEEEILKHEKEALGFYISGHPLTRYSKQLKKIGTKKTSELEEVPDGEEVRIGGILRDIKKIQTKAKAEIMAYFTLEDPDGNIEVIVFPELYRASISLLQKDTPLLVKGTVDKTEKGIKIVSTQISSLDELGTKKVHKVEISLKYPLSETISLQKLKSVILSNSEGEYPLYLRIFFKGTETLIATGVRISRDNEIINRIEEITGKGAVTFQ
jgi:DNA polymerase-3 subunit alpha